jgi:hypothetical protein
LQLVYDFTPDERRVISQAFQQYLQVVQVIANLHNPQGALSVAPDGSGLIEPVLADS